MVLDISELTELWGLEWMLTFSFSKLRLNFVMFVDFIMNRKVFRLILAALLVESLIESKMGSSHSMGNNTLCLLINLQTVSMVRNWEFSLVLSMDLVGCNIQRFLIAQNSDFTKIIN